MDEKSALRIEYDFKNRIGTVAFPKGHNHEREPVIDYFEDASEGKVERIDIFIEDALYVTLIKEPEGEGWTYGR